MAEILTSRLLLRPWRASDVDFVLDMYSRWEVQRFLGTAPRVLTTREQALAQVERYRALRDPVLGVWAVSDRESGALHGNALLKVIPLSGGRESREVEIGWHLHPDSWGHGYAREAAGAVLAHAVAGGLDRVVAVTNPQNFASQRVALAIGMEHRGRTDRYYDTTCELFVAEQGPGASSS